MNDEFQKLRAKEDPSLSDVNFWMCYYQYMSYQNLTTGGMAAEAKEYNLNSLENVMRCFINDAKEELNKTHCNILYPLERDLGYWDINQTWLDAR